MFYLESIHSVDYVEGFLDDYHSSKNKILFLNNRKNELTDQSPTMDNKIETYVLQYMCEHELGCVQQVSDKSEKSILEEALKCVVSIIEFFPET